MIAIDANILIYSFDDAVPVKHTQARVFLEQLFHEGVTPVLMWQAACETLSWLRRRLSEGRFSAIDVATKFQSLSNAYPLIYPSHGVLESSFELQKRHSLSHWDRLLLAACIAGGIDTLYSEDMSHGVKYDSVTVLNPLLPV